VAAGRTCTPTAGPEPHTPTRNSSDSCEFRQGLPVRGRRGGRSCVTYRGPGAACPSRDREGAAAVTYHAHLGTAPSRSRLGSTPVCAAVRQPRESR